MRNILILSALLTLSLSLAAQSATPASGASVSNQNGMFSFTLGQHFSQSDFETAVSVNTTTAYVTEGVQQPFTIDQLDIEGVNGLQQAISIYPNPTKDALTISSEEIENDLEYALFDLGGKQLLKGRMTGATTLHIGAMASGSYILVVNDGMGRKNIFRIIKIN